STSCGRRRVRSRPSPGARSSRRTRARRTSRTASESWPARACVRRAGIRTRACDMNRWMKRLAAALCALLVLPAAAAMDAAQLRAIVDGETDARIEALHRALVHPDAQLAALLQA